MPKNDCFYVLSFDIFEIHNKQRKNQVPNYSSKIELKQNLWFMTTASTEKGAAVF